MVHTYMRLYHGYKFCDVMKEKTIVMMTMFHFIEKEYKEKSKGNVDGRLQQRYRNKY